MTYTTGSGYLGDATGYAASGGPGTLTIIGGTYSLASFYAAREGATGTLTLDQGATVSVAEPSGAPDAVFGGDVDVGESSDPAAPSVGTLNILGGSVLAVETTTTLDDNGFIAGGYQTVDIGVGEAGSGVALVSGAGSAIELSGGATRVRVGRDGGDGVLTVEAGGEVLTQDLDIGRENGAIGTVIIDGPGSRIVSSGAYGRYGPDYAAGNGFIHIGRDTSTGSLYVQNGGQLLSRDVEGETGGGGFELGRETGSSGYVLVTGAGSSVVVEQSSARDLYGSPNASIGTGGNGVLRVLDSASLSILGDGANLTVSRGRDGVADGQSLLEIAGGSTVLVDSRDFLDAALRIGDQPGTDGMVIVSGMGSSLTVRSDDVNAGAYRDGRNSYATGEIIVGNLGRGVLTAEDGAIVTARELLVGARNVYADGNPSGIGGSGTVTVASGAEVNILSYAGSPYQGIRLGNASNAEASVTVTGEGSRLTIAGAEATVPGAGEGAARLEVGRAGTASLAISDGGYVGAFFIEVGRGSGAVTADGTLTIDGPGSTLFASDAFGTFLEFEDGVPTGEEVNESAFMRVGRLPGTEGTVEITNGGLLAIETDPAGDKVFPGLRLGQEVSARGSLTVDGIARAEGGTPILDDEGAEIRSEVRLVQNRVSEDAENRGGVFLELGGSAGDGLENGTGTMVVSNGALVSLTGNNPALVVAEGDAFEPAEGEPSRQSRLTIESGGEVVLDTGAEAVGESFFGIGLNVGADGAVTVTGAGSLLSVTARQAEEVENDFGSATVVVGRNGTASLDVLDGARVVIDGTNGLFPGMTVGRGIGDAGGGIRGEGTVTVSGAGSEIVIAGTNESSIAASGFINVGRMDGSRGSVTISDGGRIALTGARDTVTQIAATDAAIGAVSVLGAASVFEAGRYLMIGGDIDEEVSGPDNTVLDDSLVFGQGEGTLFVREGTVIAEEIFLGPNSLIDAASVLIGDTLVLGRLEIADGAVGTLDLVGDLTLEPGATLGFDVTSAGGALGNDFLSVTGMGRLDLGAIEIDLLAPDRLSLGEGEVVLASFAGGLSMDSSARVGNRSALLDLVAEDDQLVLRQGSAVSFEQARTVGLLYEIGLDRDGALADDLDGFNFNIDGREAGLSETALAELFITVPEFVDRFGDVDSLSNEDYVTLLYDNALGRISDQSGFDFWVSALDQGVSNATVLLLFAKSPENQVGSAYLDGLSEIEPGFWGFA